MRIRSSNVRVYYLGQAGDDRESIFGIDTGPDTPRWRVRDVAGVMQSERNMDASDRPRAWMILIAYNAWRIDAPEGLFTGTSLVKLQRLISQYATDRSPKA